VNKQRPKASVRRQTGARPRKREKVSLPPAGSEKDQLAALCREKGLRGLRERDVADLGYLSEERLQALSEQLEAEGKVKILSFSPLFLVSQESFDYFCEKMLAYLEQFHKRHPAMKGIPLEKIKERFGIAEMVLWLAVKTLEKAGKVRVARQRLMLAAHEVALSPQEEKILRKLEEMCYRGEFQSVSLSEVRREFRLSAERLDRLLAILAERRKIIQGPEGLFIHSRWLDETVDKVKGLGKKEMTVGDFKAITGLSRKYAIPLLELLDQMGVTRRKGSIREIL
jgi:selenocysteine-specific elongation factor